MPFHARQLSPVISETKLEEKIGPRLHSEEIKHTITTGPVPVNSSSMLTIQFLLTNKIAHLVYTTLPGFALVRARAFVHIYKQGEECFDMNFMYSTGTVCQSFLERNN